MSNAVAASVRTRTHKLEHRPICRKDTGERHPHHCRFLLKQAADHEEGRSPARWTVQKQRDLFQPHLRLHVLQLLCSVAASLHTQALVSCCRMHASFSTHS